MQTHVVKLRNKRTQETTELSVTGNFGDATEAAKHVLSQPTSHGGGHEGWEVIADEPATAEPAKEEKAV